MPSYEKRPSGTWSVRFRDNGKNLRLSGYPSKREAQAAYLAYLNEPKEERKEESKPLLFSDVANEYIQDLYNHCKESSIYTIRSKVEKHLIPAFGFQNLQDITPACIQKWQNGLEGSISYRIGLRELLASILKYAYRIYDIPYVMPKVTPIRNKERKKEMSIWTKDQMNIFLEHCTEEPYSTLYLLLYYSGMRKGEARALMWSDISGNTISISKTATNKSIDAPYAITAPKTKGSYRKIQVPPFVIERINALPHNGDFIFTLDGENPISERPIEKRWKESIKDANLPEIRIHDLRHSHASLLISSGVPITAVSRRLGHDNVTVTLNTYAHIMPSDDDIILDALLR